MSILKNVGFIGGGQMCTALMGGLIRSNVIAASQVSVSDPKPACIKSINERFNVYTTLDNKDIVRRSDIVTLCVKPASVGSVLKAVADDVDITRHLIVSICAGVTSDTILSYLPAGTRVVRVMPNTPSLVGYGASGYALGINALPEDSDIVKTMMSAVGIAHEVKESDLDAVTGVSGSGPAYVFMMIEALADGGVKAGLTRQVALSLAAQTVLGSAQMVIDSGTHPALLKDAVASPNGTTIAAIHALEKNGFRNSLIEAVEAASTRSKELAAASELQIRIEKQKAQEKEKEKEKLDSDKKAPSIRL